MDVYNAMRFQSRPAGFFRFYLIGVGAGAILFLSFNPVQRDFFSFLLVDIDRLIELGLVRGFNPVQRDFFVSTATNRDKTSAMALAYGFNPVQRDFFVSTMLTGSCEPGSPPVLQANVSIPSSGIFSFLPKNGSVFLASEV